MKFEITPERRKVIHQMLEEAMNEMEQIGDLHGESHNRLIPVESSVKDLMVDVDLELLLTPRGPDGRVMSTAQFDLRSMEERLQRDREFDAIAKEVSDGL